VFLIQDLAKTYADLVSIKEFVRNIAQAEERLDDDSKECLLLLLRLNALHKIH
jgi:hypothetical protein